MAMKRTCFLYIFSAAFAACMGLAFMTGCGSNDPNAEAKKILEDRCQMCHDLPQKNMKAPEEWKPFLEGHAARAELTQEQVETLAKYLAAR